jgi:hypothetical protein
MDKEYEIDKRLTLFEMPTKNAKYTDAVSQLSFYLYVCVKHLHNLIISLRRQVWAHKNSLTLPLLIEVPVPSQESKQSCICVRGINFLIGFWNCSDSVVFFFPFYSHIS